MSEERSEELEEDVQREEETARRDETLKLEDIDTEYYSQFINERITEWDSDHEQFFEDREDWLLACRDLKYQPMGSQDSDINVPFMFTMKKAMHARIYQTFSQKNFFNVESHNDAFVDKEKMIRDAMQWVWSKHINRGEGSKHVVDDGLNQGVGDGSMILKWSWDRWTHEYQELDWVVEMTEEETIEENELGEFEPRTQTIGEKVLRDVEKIKKLAAACVTTIKIDDFKIPQGFRSPQSAPWVSHRIWMTDDDMRDKAQLGKFDEDAVEEAIEQRRAPSNYQGDNQHGSQAREALAGVEGVNSQWNSTGHMAHDTYNHAVHEFYCRGIVGPNIMDEDYRDIDAKPQEIIIYWHEASRKVLGWTYLHRLCPDGKRPFAKADFVPSEERAFGIGTNEMLYSLQMYINAMHQLKMDNGMLSSMQWGVYRGSSSLKPNTFRMRHGELLPVEDINDVKLFQFPYLGDFGENEEMRLTNYGEKLLAINDINMGNLSAKGVAGSLRNATGASFVDRQSNIQLHPHLDRFATAFSRVLSSLFILYRERISNKLIYRVTGTDGRPIFGEIDRDTLQGDYDFTIDVDLMGMSDAEKQQQSTLMLQTLLNPTFMQLGIVDPTNLYNVLENHLITHGVKRPYLYITKPVNYRGVVMTPEQRVFRIIHGYLNPPPADTIQLGEDHQAALQYLVSLQEPGNESIFGLINTQEKLAEYVAMIEKHQNYMQGMSNPNAMANSTGTQMPAQGGLPGLGPTAEQGGGGVPDAGAPQGGPLGSPQGEPNGPVF